MRSVSVMAGLVARICSQDTPDDSSSRTRTGEKRFLRLFPRGDRLLLRYRREVFEEFREQLRQRGSLFARTVEAPLPRAAWPP